MNITLLKWNISYLNNAIGVFHLPLELSLFKNELLKPLHVAQKCTKQYIMYQNNEMYSIAESKHWVLLLILHRQNSSQFLCLLQPYVPLCSFPQIPFILRNSLWGRYGNASGIVLVDNQSICHCFCEQLGKKQSNVQNS